MKSSISLFRPGADTVHLEVRGEIVEATPLGEGRFEFQGIELGPLDYRIYHSDGTLAHDPYAFSPVIGPLDEHLFNEGRHYELYHMLGARPITHEGIKGTAFAVWAPNALQVSLVSDLNAWDGRLLPMRRVGTSGVWELFVPGVGQGMRYKYEVLGCDGKLRLKTDPYARFGEKRPNNASIVWETESYDWKDRQWQARPGPMVIYEVHLGSWKGELNYRELATELSTYCVEMGYTHVELLPVTEHPLDESWGYQVSGYFAPTSRFGSPTDFQYLVDHLHGQGIGVIVDWVPAHFPNDDHALSCFDGTALYEHADERQGWHPQWETHIFNYGRHEVANFLIASALYWAEVMRVDGLRVDAVASMLYLDFARKDWLPNIHGGNENLEAIEFIKHLNGVLHERCPGFLTFAEESSEFSGVTAPLDQGGLGFDYKWNMGWMNDTLTYFQKEPVYRSYHQNQLTFGIMYAFSERFLLPLSHDEVVHGKRSLLSKMPGDEWQQFANLRLLYSYMICQPGVKLLFMGQDMGVPDEWNCKKTLPWNLLDHPYNRGVHEMVRTLNHLYQAQPDLWRDDFKWVDFSDTENNVISYWRGSLLCVHNFSPNYHAHYTVRSASLPSLREIFNSDSAQYGGSNKCNSNLQPHENGVDIVLAPLATMIFAAYDVGA